MEDLIAIWNYSFFSLGQGIEITIGRAVSVLVFVVVSVLLGGLLSRLLARRLTRGDVDANARQIIVRVFYWVFLVLVVITTLGMLRIPITHFAFISGAIAIGVGFGAQNIINNLISSWILMSEKPVRINDFVELDQHMGIVESIGNRSTRIRRIDGVHVLVPNSQLLERIVVNWTLVDRRFRSSVRVGVAYGSDVNRVAELIRQSTIGQPGVLSDPPAVVVFEDFGDNALVFDLFFWCEVAAGGELRLIRSGLRFGIERLFRENGIVVAFPQRDVHLDTSAPLEIRMLQAGGEAAERGGDQSGNNQPVVAGR